MNELYGVHTMIKGIFMKLQEKKNEQIYNKYN